MRNSSTRKNPYTSLGFGATNKATGSARGVASAANRLQVASLRADAARQVIDFWSGNGSTAPMLPMAPKPAVPPSDPPSASLPATPQGSRLKIVLRTDPRAPRRQPLVEHVDGVLRVALARFGERVTRVDAHLSAVQDQEHPGAIQCQLQASLAELEPVLVKHVADDAHQAIVGAVAKLKRAVGSELAKRDPRRSAAAESSSPTPPDTAADSPR